MVILTVDTDMGFSKIQLPCLIISEASHHSMKAVIS